MAFIPLLHHLPRPLLPPLSLSLTFSHSLSLLLRIVPRCRCASWCPFWCSMLVLIASVTLDLTTLHRFNIKNGPCECPTNRQTDRYTHSPGQCNKWKALSGALQVGQKQQNGLKKRSPNKKKNQARTKVNNKKGTQLIARLADTLQFSQRKFIKK